MASLAHSSPGSFIHGRRWFGIPNGILLAGWYACETHNVVAIPLKMLLCFLSLGGFMEFHNGRVVGDMPGMATEDSGCLCSVSYLQ